MKRTAPIAVLALLIGLLTATPAGADLQHPRQAFLRDSVAGLFLHWGERTSPQHTSCSAWEADVTNGGWTPAYWVNEAKKLHAQYIVLATFHSRLGYARPYPSQIPGSCRTTRDFLGELIDAADAQGLKVIHYMTDDPQWHNEGLSSGSWLNSSAFSSHVGRTVDLTTRDGFGEFSYLQFFEQMQRYPKLAGFWIDNDNAYWERNNLYAKIYQQRPDMTISNNNEDTPIMDMISNEQKTGMTPSYDYPQAIYTALPRLIEADFKLPTSGPWWYGGSDQAVDRKLMSMIYGRYAHGAWTLDRGENLLDGGAPFYDTYECADGRHVAVGAIEAGFFAKLVDVLGVAGSVDLAAQRDPSTWPAMRELFAKAFMTATREEWAERFAGADACVTPVLTMDEVVAHPHNAARESFFTDSEGAIHPAPAPRFAGTPCERPAPAPVPGRDTRAILSELGHTSEDIDSLLAEGAVR